MLAAAVPLVALFATSVLAQGGSIPGLPQCAQGCVTDYGGCNQVDVKCICTNTALLEKLSCCVSQNCDEAGTRDVIDFADSLCGSYGVTTLPTAATCASTAATASATAAPSGTRTGSATMSMTSAPSGTGAAGASTHSGTHTGTGTTEAGGSATSAAASATESAFAIKNYKAEGLGMGMAVLGFLAGL